MPAPIPVVTPIDTFMDLPAGGQVPLSCAGSTVLPGATYEWQLVERPDGSTATLQNANTSTPLLTNVDVRGTYIVFLKITDSGGSSHAYPYPVQATTVPYGFTTPLATAFGVVRVAESPTGLVKPGRGEYGWFEQGLWPLIAKVNDGLDFEFYDKPTRTLTANAVRPDDTTGVDYVEVNGLNILDTTASIVLTTTGNPLTIGTPTTVSSADLTVIGGILRADEIHDASGADLKLVANAEMLLYGGTRAAVEAPDEILLSSDSNSVRVSPTEARLSTGANLVSVRDAAEVEPDVVITAGAAGADVVITAAAEVRVASAADLTLTTTGTDGDIALSTQGATGNISLATQGYVAGISVATTGTDADISLTATGASASIGLTSAGGITATSTGAASDLSLSSARKIQLTASGAGDAVVVRALNGAVDVEAWSYTNTASTECAISTLNGPINITVGGDAVEYDQDQAATLSFSANNKRRIIDLDGFVSQRNHTLTSGTSVTPVTPNGTETFVPLRGGIIADYHYDALCGPSVLPEFSMSFYASFLVTGFTTTPAATLTFKLVAYAASNPAGIIELATFEFSPGGTIEVTARPCIIQGMIHSTGSKVLYTSGTASLQLNSAAVATQLAASAVDATDALTASQFTVFAYRVNSTDADAQIGNLSASFSLLRGS